MRLSISINYQLYCWAGSKSKLLGFSVIISVNGKLMMFHILNIPYFPGVMGEYEPKIEVHFPYTVTAARGTTVKMECFALGK